MEEQENSVDELSGQVCFEAFLSPYHGLAEDIREIAEPIIDAEGCELVFFQLIRGKESVTLRFFIDRKHGVEAEAHVLMQDLEKVNKRLGNILDVEDGQRGLFKNTYRLEVSSPGLERHLAKKSHYQQSLGKEIKMHLRDARDGGRAHQGIVEVVNDEGVTLQKEQESFVVKWAEIESAKRVYRFASAQKKKSNKKKSK